jgi:hypothetical protein
METPFTYSEDEVKEIVHKAIERTCPDFNENMRTKIADELYEDLRKKEERVFYRVCNQHTLRGLWYDFNGNFTGIIHNEFNFCKHKDLEMDFDPELVGWLSATDTLDKLFEWFPPSDIIKLQDEGWYLHKFIATDVKFYDRFQHLVIKQETSKPIGVIMVQEVKTLNDNPEIATVKDDEAEYILIH